jgi:uncharacterized protein
MKVLLLALICVASAATEPQAEVFRLSRPLSDASLSDAMPSLAQWVVENYRDDNRYKYLNNLFRAQIVAQDYQRAIGTIRELRALRTATPKQMTGSSVKVVTGNLQYELLARAALGQATGHTSFETAVQDTIRAAKQS